MDIDIAGVIYIWSMFLIPVAVLAVVVAGTVFAGIWFYRHKKSQSTTAVPWWLVVVFVSIGALDCVVIIVALEFFLNIKLGISLL